jgi:glycosyltransferase involved in cell wall biosynthesis
VVVDNGSTDATPQVVEAWAAQQPFNCRLVHEPRKGLGCARNAGLREAKGDVLAFTDDDCQVAENYYAALAREYRDIRGPAVIGGRVEIGDPLDLKYTYKNVPERQTFDGRNWGFILGCNFTFNRAAYVAIGPFDERFGPGALFRSADDIDFIIRGYLAGVPVLYTPDTCVYHFHGRRTRAQFLKVVDDYAAGNGALYAKYRSTPIAFKLRWTLKGLLRELIHGVQNKSETGHSQRRYVFGMVRGAWRYWSHTAQAALKGEGDRYAAVRPSIAPR